MLLSGLNTQGLIKHGWNGSFFDAIIDMPAIHLHKRVLTRQTIAAAFASIDLPKEPDYISIDVDSVDLWLLLGLLEGGYRPRVFSIEYNPNFDTDQLVTCQEEWHAWTGRTVYGASAGAINHVAAMHGCVPW